MYPWHRYAARLLLKNRPSVVRIEPTSHCNANCVMCAYGCMSRARGYMGWGTFENALNQSIELGVDEVILNYYGEPLLHPDLGRMVKEAAVNGVNVSLDTNGILLDEDVARTILGAGVDVVVSLHGLDPESYAKVHRVEAFDRVVANTRRLLEIRHAQGLHNTVTVQTALLDTNPMNEAEVRGRLCELFGSEVALSITECGDVAGQCFEDHRRVKKPFKRTTPCRSLLDQLAVMWNGDVTVCCSDADGRLKIGNVGESTLAQLWRSPRHKRMQWLHLLGRYGDMPLCVHCSG